jgi:transposase InsO family protein
MDFVTGLPWSDGYNAILVVTCGLTKIRRLIHCRNTTTAEQVADLFLEDVFGLRGLPRSIISNRGTQFVAKFWKAMCKRRNTLAHLSTPYHPLTHGQTERFNTVMEQYLLCFVKNLQDDWNSWLLLSKFAANNQASESTSVSSVFGS